MKNLFFLLLFVVFVGKSQQNLIPKPSNLTNAEGQFILDSSVQIILNDTKGESQAAVQIFKDFLLKSGVALKSIKSSNSKPIFVNINEDLKAELGAEGYQMQVSKAQIVLNASTNAGIFNGLQSLRQLVESSLIGEGNQKIAQIPACKITDTPRFAWRGLMLDVSRNFFTVEEVKAYIDMMSRFKFNVLHWHLTDDEGWRIEIKSLPKLTEVGAWRVERNGRFGENRPFPKPGEKATVGGFYTQEQIKDVVAYAAQRNVTIVPEIDVPGHSMAALAAYPELSTKKEPHFVNPGSKFSEWYGNGTFKMLIENTLNPADEKVYEFLDKVFTEVAALFPGQYIHMGGDESYHGYWDADKNVKAFMKKNNLKDTHALQSYFVGRVAKIVNAKGKKLIGWDEILEGGELDKSTAVMSWRGVKGGIEAAKKGNNVVMTPTTYGYLDYTQGDHSVENPIYNNLSLEKTYSFEPIPDGVDPKLILGGQGNLWTEVIPTLPYAFYMTYPRALAIAETYWSGKENKNYADFLRRVENQIMQFEAENVNISKAIYDAEVNITKEGSEYNISLKNDIKEAEIFYSIDNTYPVKYAKKYTQVFVLPEGKFNLRTQVYKEGKPLGRELIINRDDLIKRVK